MRSLVLSLVLLSVPALARAQVTSAWELAETCPSAGAAADRAAAALADAPPAELRVSIERSEALHHARMTLTGSVEADRSLSDPDCDALVEATVLLAALALGLPAPAPAEPPAPAAAQAEPALAAAVDPSPRTPAPRTAEAPVTLLLAAGAVLETALPAPPIGLSLEVGLAYGALRVAVGARAWPSMHVARNGTEGASLWAVVGVLRVGARFEVTAGQLGRLELGGQGRVGLGVLHGSGYGVVLPQAGGAPLFWIGADAGATWWPDPHAGLSLDVGATIPVVRPAFELDAAALFEAADAGLRIALGAVVRFS